MDTAAWNRGDSVNRTTNMAQDWVNANEKDEYLTRLLEDVAPLGTQR